MLHVLSAHFGYSRDFDAMCVELLDEFKRFQVVILIKPDVCIGALRLEQAISFFPDPQGMCFNTREFRKIAYAIDAQNRLK